MKTKTMPEKVVPHVTFTEQEASYLLSAVWNYIGMGSTRSDVLTKLRGLLPEDVVKQIYQVYAPKTLTRAMVVKRRKKPVY